MPNAVPADIGKLSNTSLGNPTLFLTILHLTIIEFTVLPTGVIVLFAL